MLNIHTIAKASSAREEEVESMPVHEWKLAKLAGHGKKLAHATMDIILNELFGRGTLNIQEYDTMVNETQSARRLSLLVQYLWAKDFAELNTLAHVLEEQKLVPELVTSLRKKPDDIQREGN